LLPTFDGQDRLAEESLQSLCSQEFMDDHAIGPHRAGELRLGDRVEGIGIEGDSQCDTSAAAMSRIMTY